MTQYVINIGALPNDGTGDPLRTAFNETNLNFDQVFAAGPVLSNVRIANNTILTTNTNGNLVLAPNGVGRIQANATIVPSVANVRDLGSLDRRWNTVYSQYLNISGTVSLADLTVNGNLTVTGNTIQIGNITTETKTIQLANAASTANAANGSGVTVGANDDIATMLYNSTSNTWNTNIGISAAGNVSGTYFIGNGSLLTGVASSYGDANVATLLASFGSNNISTDGNITTNYLFGNVAELLGQNARGEHSANLGAPGFTHLASNVVLQVTGNANSYSQINFQNINNGNHSTTDYVATADFGNDSNYFINMGIAGSSYDPTDASNSLGNALQPQDGYVYAMGGNSVGGTGGNLVVGSNEPGGVVRVIADGSFASNVVATFSNTGIDVKGNIVPTSNNVFSLGNATNQWNDLYVSNATIFMNNVPISLTAGNVLTVDGEAVLTNDSNTTITTTGNITADYFFGNTQGLIGNITNLDSVNFAVENIGALVGNNGVNIGAGGNNNLVVLPAEVLIQNVPLTVSGNILSTVAGGLNITANTVANGIAQIWNFGTDGRLTFPGTPRIDTDANNFEVQAAESINFEANAVVNIYTDTSGTTYQWQFGDSGDLSVPGDVQFADGSIITDNLEATGDFGISTAANVGFMIDTNEAAHTWTFDTTGNLNLSNGGSIIVDGGDGVIGPDGDNMVISWDNEDLILRSVGGDVDVEADRDFNIRVNYDGGATDYLTKWVFGQDNEIINITGNSAIITEAGNLNLQGGRNTLSSGNVQITAVDTGVAVNTWTFDNTGNLNLPASGHLVGTTANNSGFIAWAGNSSGDGLGYTTMGLIPDDTLVNNDQYLILDPTAPGHIHLRAGGTQDNSGAMLFLGGENSHFKVNSGSNPSLEATANNYSWTFGTDGKFSLPAAESPGQYSEITSVGNSSGDGNGYATLQLKPDSNVGGDSYLIIDPTAPNHIHIRAGGAQDNSGAQLFLGGENSYFLVENGANSNVYVASNSNQWKFDTTGILTLPGEGVLQSLNDTVTLSSLNTTTGNANSVYLGSGGGLGFNDQEIGGNWLEIFRSGSDPEIRVPPGGGNILIAGASGSSGAGGRDITITAGPADQTNYYTTAGGTVNIVGGLGATDDGGGGGPGGNVNITAGVSADPAGHAGNVKIACGPNSWVFDYSGNVTLPGNINAVLASPAPSLNGFNSVNAVNVSASGNITGGNLTVGSGTITGGNVNGSVFNGNVAFGTGTVGGSGNITGGNISAIGNITGNTAGFAIGYRDIPQVSFTGNATIATTDAGKHFYSTQSSNFTLTIANNASQGFQVGAAITIVNQGTGTISIAQGSGVTLYLAGNATSGNRTVATFGMATIMKVATDTWFINGTGVS
jgi:hypothetical protein